MTEYDYRLVIGLLLFAMLWLGVGWYFALRTINDLRDRLNTLRITVCKLYKV